MASHAVSPDDVIDVLRPVQDPELHRSIVELDMVRDVAVSGNAITVTLGTDANGDLESTADDVRVALGAAGPAALIDVALTAGTDGSGGLGAGAGAPSRRAGRRRRRLGHQSGRQRLWRGPDPGRPGDGSDRR